MTNQSPTTRLRLRPWREPRLLLGVLLVLGATVLGARLAAAGDRTVEYWTVRSAVTPGDGVSEEILEPARVQLSESAGSNYIRADEEFVAPLDELEWAHELAPGSLVGKASLVTRGGTSDGELPLSVAQGAAPGDLERGDRVDVWVGPGPGDDQAIEAERVLEAVKVLQTGDEGAALSGASARTILVEVAQAQLSTSVIGTVAAGHVTLVRVS